MIEREETRIVGRWLLEAGRVVGDANCDRIEILVRDHLVFVADAPEGWFKLYRDPVDARLWEKSYPESHLHGGGPPMLSLVSNEEAAKRYGHVA